MKRGRGRGGGNEDCKNASEVYKKLYQKLRQKVFKMALVQFCFLSNLNVSNHKLGHGHDNLPLVFFSPQILPQLILNQNSGRIFEIDDPKTPRPTLDLLNLENVTHSKGRIQMLEPRIEIKSEI